MAGKFDKFLGEFREKDEGGGSEFNPKGVYPFLIAGGLIGKDSDAIQDLLKSYIFRTTAGDNSVSDGYARIIAYHGNVINGTPFLASRFIGNGFNALDLNSIKENKTINDEGEIIEEEGSYVAIIHVVACNKGAGNENGYVINHKDGTEANIFNVGFNVNKNAETTTLIAAATHGVSNSYLPTQEGYLFVATDNINDLCAHLAWSGYRDADYETPEISTCELPMCHTWGMALAGTIYDEVTCNLKNNKHFIKKITRTNRTLLSGLTWEEIKTYHEPESGDPYYTYQYKSTDIRNEVKPNTSNITCHNLPDNCVISINENGTIIIDAGTIQMTPETDFTTYLYFELNEYLSEEYEGDLQVYVWDFGTEEIIGNGIAPRAISTEYLTNYTDFIRNLYLNQNEDNINTEKIIFESTPNTIYATDKNLLVKEINCYACNTPTLDGATLAVGTTITKNTIHSIGVTMTDTNSLIIIKTQTIG